MSDSLKARIQADVKDAMRNKDKERLATLRLITAAIKQREVDERTELDDIAVLAVLEKMLKQRRDSVAQYRNGGRDELAAREEAEMAIIQAYLPTPLSEEALETLIDEAISATGAASVKEMGKVMGVVKEKARGRADMGTVSALIKARLSA